MNQAESTAQAGLDGFPHVRRENIRYRDTDRQGHVNNAVFSTFYECSRTAILFDPERKLVSPERQFVIVKSEMEFLSELTWPGYVDIGTRITHIGRSAVVTEQVIYQNGHCAGKATNVMVLMDTHIRKSTPLPAHVRDALADFHVAS